jgi:hypothetical protein
MFAAFSLHYCCLQRPRAGAVHGYKIANTTVSAEINIFNLR